jgi:hypothetical protein
MQEVDKKKDNISVSSFSCRAKVKVYIYPAFTKWNSAEKGICFSASCFGFLCYQKFLCHLSVKIPPSRGYSIGNSLTYVTLWMLLGSAHLQFALLIRKGLASHLDTPGFCSGTRHDTNPK